MYGSSFKWIWVKWLIGWQWRWGQISLLLCMCVPRRKYWHTASPCCHFILCEWMFAEEIAGSESWLAVYPHADVVQYLNCFFIFHPNGGVSEACLHLKILVHTTRQKIDPSIGLSLEKPTSWGTYYSMYHCNNRNVVLVSLKCSLSITRKSWKLTREHKARLQKLKAIVSPTVLSYQLG